MNIVNRDFMGNNSLIFEEQKLNLVESNSDSFGPEQIKELSEKILLADELNDSPHTFDIATRVQILNQHMQASMQMGDIQAVWNDLEKILNLRPYHDEFINLVPLVANKLRTEQKTNVVLIISCWHRLENARKTKDIINKNNKNYFKVLIVVGKKDGLEIASHMENDLLIVNAPDNYESLPLKVQSAFHFVYKNYGEGSCCFKIDEDLQIKNAEILTNLMKKLSESSLKYSGFCGNNPYYSDRTWHFGKCQNKVISRRPYGRRHRSPYAYGGFYYLSYTALETFVTATLKFPDEIQGQVYEDMYVGFTLFEEGIKITPFNPNEWSFALISDWWTADRFFGGPTYKLT